MNIINVKQELIEDRVAPADVEVIYNAETGKFDGVPTTTLISQETVTALVCVIQEEVEKDLEKIEEIIDKSLELYYYNNKDNNNKDNNKFKG